MRDQAARMRAGLIEPIPTSTTDSDPRVRVELAHLRRLAGAAKALRFLPRQAARSVLNGRHASRHQGAYASILLPGVKAVERPE